MNQVEYLKTLPIEVQNFISEMVTDYYQMTTEVWQGTYTVQYAHYTDVYGKDFSNCVDQLLKVFPTENKAYISKCECGKDKHGFTSHCDWCPCYKENKLL